MILTPLRQISNYWSNQEWVNQFGRSWYGTVRMPDYQQNPAFGGTLLIEGEGSLRTWWAGGSYLAAMPQGTAEDVYPLYTMLYGDPSGNVHWHERAMMGFVAKTGGLNTGSFANSESFLYYSIEGHFGHVQTDTADDTNKVCRLSLIHI